MTAVFCNSGGWRWWRCDIIRIVKGYEVGYWASFHCWRRAPFGGGAHCFLLGVFRLNLLGKRRLSGRRFSFIIAAARWSVTVSEWPRHAFHANFHPQTRERADIGRVDEGECRGRPADSIPRGARPGGVVHSVLAAPGFSASGQADAADEARGVGFWDEGARRQRFSPRRAD